MNKFIFGKEVSIAIAGEAGQGIDTITEIIAETIKENSLNVFYTKEYMSRITGGCNSSTIRLSSNKVCTYKENVDFAFAISTDALNHLEKRFSENTIIIYEFENQEVIDKFPNSVKINLSSIAKELGGSIFKNTIIAGIIIGILNLDIDLFKKTLQKKFAGKPIETIEKNLQASITGYGMGKEISKEKYIVVDIPKDVTTKDEILINGNDSAAIGCIAGGADFISAYPMSPSTGILTFLAKTSSEFNIIVEQAEDEIAAINMGLGAWYAGARALTSTSGGGFALMCEAVSLSGMTETPMVIYLGQRPGPATGLPTRTEQGDLNLALYSGHGEFPRIILTPGTLEDCFNMAQKAFNLADKFQIPVFILSDQYLVDSCYNTKPFDIKNTEITDYIEKTTTGYKRYAFSANGISPRGVPSYGEGLVVVDSDEHNEQGHITENLDTRIKMVDKRMSKLDSIKKEFIEPDYFGEVNAKSLVVSWGSTCNAIKEALFEINNPDIAFLYFKQVYPLNDSILNYFQNKEKIICVENNYAGQFANLLKVELNISADEKILKYSGLQFSVEEIILKINEVLK